MNTALLWGGPEHGRIVLIDVAQTPAITAHHRPMPAPWAAYVPATYTRRIVADGAALFAVYVHACEVPDVRVVLHDKRVRPLEAEVVALCK